MASKKAPVPKICHTYPTVMKLGTVIPYLKKIEKYKNDVTHSLSSAEISIFQWKSRTFAISRNKDKVFYLYKKISILLIFFEFVKVILINMVAILILPAKLVTLGILKIKVFWNEGYDVIIFVHDVTRKFYLLTQIIFQISSCNPSLVTRDMLS